MAEHPRPPCPPKVPGAEADVRGGGGGGGGGGNSSGGGGSNSSGGGL